MRIVYFTHYYTPEGNAPATRVSSFAKRWVSAGHDVTVITCAPNVPHGRVYDGYRNRIWPQTESIDGVEVIRVWTWIAANKGVFGRVLNYMSYMVAAFLVSITIKRPDIFIATSPQFFCGWAGVLYACWTRWTSWLSKRPRFVLEIRDLWPESIGAVRAINDRFILSVLQMLEKWMYANADTIVTVGEGYRKRLIERGVAPASISVVMNGWDEDTPRPKEEEIAALRSQWSLEGKFVCAYIGTIGMACGLDIYLRAAQLLRKRGIDDIKLVAVGDGAQRESLEKQAQSLHLDTILFTGLQSKKSVSNWLALSDVCFVHLKKTPLFETVIPSKIFEAAGFRRPILIGVGGDAKEIVEVAGAGIAIEPENEEQMVDSLIRLKDNPQLRAKLGDSGYGYITSHFSRDNSSLQYLRVLQTQLATCTELVSEPREEIV